MKRVALRLIVPIIAVAGMACSASTMAYAAHAHRGAKSARRPAVSQTTRRPAVPTGAKSRVAPRVAPATARGRAFYGYRFGTRFHRIGFRGSFFYRPWWWWGYWPYSSWWYGPPYYGVGYGYPGSVGIGPAAVDTDISPEKATVKLDGEEVGIADDYDGTWDELAVEPGNHVLEFEAPGRQTLRVALDAKPGLYYRIAYKLKEGDGIDPASESMTPRSLPEPPMPPPGFEPPSGNGPPPNDSQPGPLTGVRSGFLKMRVTPGDAAVYLDGEFLARADELAGLHGAIPVAEGEHRVEVVRPGYGTRQVTVRVDQGKSVDVNVELEETN